MKINKVPMAAIIIIICSCGNSTNNNYLKLKSKLKSTQSNLVVLKEKNRKLKAKNERLSEKLDMTQNKHKKFSVNMSNVEKHINQTDMTLASLKEYQKAQEALELIYKKVLASYKKNKFFIKKLTSAQAAWHKYYNLHVESIMGLPSGINPRLIYGSSYYMCYNLLSAKLIWERVRELNKWLNESHDACSGSYHYYKGWGKTPDGKK